MSTIIPSPIGPATTAKRGTMSAADKAKLDGIPEGGGSGAVTAVTEANGLTLTAGVLALSQAPVTVAASPTGWLTLVGQALTFALVSASQTVAGVVDLAAQTFAGVKTFVAEAVFSAGILSTGVRAASASLLLRSDLGAGSGDRCVTIGPSTLDGSVNAAAKVASFGTGNDGTNFVEKAYITKSAIFYLVGTDNYIATTGSSCNIRFTPGQITIAGTAMNFQVQNFYTAVVDGAGSVQRWDSGGTVSVRGTDSTGTPGAATIAKPIGKSSIAAGASSVVITNSLAAAASHCIITPHARDATCKELIAVCAAGTITVSGSANATANLPFSWELKTLI